MATDNTTPIVNMALMRIGAKLITAYNDGSPNSIKAMLVYQHLLTKILEDRDWRFSKLRVQVTKNSIAPLYGYQFAYKLPVDFLRLSMSHYPQMRGLNPIAYPPGYWYQVIDTTGFPTYYDYDPRVYPGGTPFVIEVIPGVSGTPDALCILTDYDDTNQPMYIDYIRNITQGNEAVFTSNFRELFICRLAQELAIPIRESPSIKEMMQKDAKAALDAAEANNEFLDSVIDETGSTAWENAGR